jgi:hypothetical protein
MLEYASINYKVHACILHASCISCFSAAPLRNCQGVNIADFRSRQVRGAEICVDWMHEGESGPTTRSNLWPAWWAPSSISWHPPLTSSCLVLLYPEKVTWQKNWVLLTFGRFLEVKNMQKQENMLHSVKTKWKGINRKQVLVLIKLSNN